MQKIERTSAGYRVHAAAGEALDAERVVLCAGQLPAPAAARQRGRRAVHRRVATFRVTQEQAYHFPYRDDAPDWPTFIHKSEGIQTYSLPGGRDAQFRGQKLAEYAAGKVLPSAYDQDRVIDPANRERLTAYVRRHLPGLVPEPYAETTCLFTTTPTEDFVLDRTGDLTIVSPCSGHGAKFAPLIGVLAAHLAGASTAAAGRAVLPREYPGRWEPRQPLSGPAHHVTASSMMRALSGIGRIPGAGDTPGRCSLPPSSSCASGSSARPGGSVWTWRTTATA